MRHKLGELGIDLERGGGGGIDGRHLVKQVGEPLKILLIAEIGAPHRVVDKLVAEVHLLGECLLREVEDCSADGEILVESILSIQPEECLPLH